MNKIGHAIAEAYYFFLWVMGFRDEDNDEGTPENREKITWMLRRQKERIGPTWWIFAPGTLVGLSVWSTWLVVRGSWWVILSIALLIFSWWLLAHVLFPYIPVIEAKDK